MPFCCGLIRGERADSGVGLARTEHSYCKFTLHVPKHEVFIVSTLHYVMFPFLFVFMRTLSRYGKAQAKSKLPRGVLIIQGETDKSALAVAAVPATGRL